MQVRIYDLCVLSPGSQDVSRVKGRVWRGSGGVGLQLRPTTAGDRRCALGEIDPGLECVSGP